MRFYANARQRTTATARYFAAGMLPMADVVVEHKEGIGAFDPVFKPVLTFVSDAYRDAVQKQLEARFRLWQDGPARQALSEDYALLADVIDFEASDGFQSGKYAPWVCDDIQIALEEGKDISVVGSLKTASAAADALMLQYYETDDAQAAAFGRDLSEDDWKSVVDVNTAYQQLHYDAPLIGVNAAHPMLTEILGELQNTDRKFTFLCGHDSNVYTVLSALDASDYELPGTVEKKTPIGVKLLFEKWLADDGTEYARVRLVYQSTEQLRNRTALTLENPPMSYDIRLPGLEVNGDGYYRLEDVLGCLRNAIEAYDALVEMYSDDSEAALEDAA